MADVILGVALGDGWGWPNEFASLPVIVSESGLRGPGLPETIVVTDDTQMTLYLHRALQRADGGDKGTHISQVIQCFLEYYHDPDNDRCPGATVMGSLAALEEAEKTGRPWWAATNPGSDGSGTVMRTAPAAALSADTWAGLTAFTAALTHGTANAVAAALVEVAVLRDLLAGTTSPGCVVRTALDAARDPGERGMLDVGDWLGGLDLPGGLAPGFAAVADHLETALFALERLRRDPWARDSDPSAIIGSGGWRGHETVAIAALAADMFPGSPWQALRRAATTGGDSDTIAAVTGAFLGALHPEVFTEAWPVLRERFEPRYAEWLDTIVAGG